MNAPLSASILSDLIREEKLRRAAEASLYEFVKQAWPTMEPGIEFVPSWHIETICEHLEAVSRGEILRLLINIPPRHSKSTIVSVAWPMWEWLKSPQQKFLCASYSSTLSIRDNLKARRLVQSPWYQERWGDSFLLAGDQNAKQRFENDKTGYRIATSVGGSVTGDGGSRLLLDDPHGAQAAQSEAMRESDLEWFDMVWSTRLNNPKTDAMVTVMQRLHEKDVSGHILHDIGGWEHICIPAEWDGVKRKTVLGSYDPRTVKGELICPARFGPDEIERLKKLLGDYGAAGQLQQEPAPAEGGIINTGKIQMWSKDESSPPMEYILQSYDTAFTEKTSGDPTACTVWGVFRHKGRYNAMLLDAWDEHMAYPQLRAKVLDDFSLEYKANSVLGAAPVKSRKADRVLIEQKGSGQSLLQDLRQGNVPVVGYNPGNADKIARAHQVTPIIDRGLVWIPESTKNPGNFVSWAAGFIKQLSRFPVAEHDDYVDTFTQAMIFLKDQGWFDLQRAKDRENEGPPPEKPVNPYAE